MLSTTSAASGKSADLLASREIKHVVVLGANGAMGLGSGALFTTAVPRVTFLARTKEKAPVPRLKQFDSWNHIFPVSCRCLISRSRRAVHRFSNRSMLK